MKNKTIKVNQIFTCCGTKNIDNRGRVPIGKANMKYPDARRFFLYVGEFGDVLLRPAAEVPLNDLLKG